MYSYDYYTGEAVKPASPQNLSPPVQEISQQEIVQNAQLYNYDPRERLGFNPAMMGYNQTMNAYGGNYMNPPTFSGYAGNPAFQFLNSMGNNNNIPFAQPVVQYEDYTYHVPGYNTGSRLLLNSDAEDECNKLQYQMMLELEESNDKRLEQQRSYYNSLGYNYYGMPYINQNYADPAIINKYKKKIDEMRQKAEEDRINFNKNLSRLCRSYLNQEIDEEELDRIYSDRVITIPATEVKYKSEQAKFDNMEPFDNSDVYRQHDKAIHDQYEKIFSGVTDLNDFFNKCGELISMHMTEDEDHKRRDMSTQYRQDGSYRRFIKQKMMERNNANSISQPGGAPFINAFPTLAQSSTLLDDGTLSITVPPWVKDNKASIVTNLMEDDYEVNRRKFIESIYRDNPKPGGGG